MRELVEGAKRFQDSVFGSQRDLFQRLAGGQRPMAVFITCSDSRIDPNLITQTGPGDLFVLRNAGNIVPPYGGTAAGGEAATIEFALAGLKVPDVIVCGHSHCGAMKAMLAEGSQLEDMPATRAWLANAEATRQVVREKHQHLEGEALLSACVEENVLVQLDNLRTHPVVAERLARKSVNLHGWVYRLETGEIHTFDRRKSQFVPLRQS